MNNQNPLLQTALDFHAAGVCVVPAAMDGSKSPIGTWKKYQVQRPSIEQIHDWFSGAQTGIGVITGAISGNLEMLELEGRAVAGGLLDEARDIAGASGLGELWEIIGKGYVEQTPSGGLHWLYRIADEVVPGNTKLARRPGENGTVEVLAETRGTGGFVVTANSHGLVHPSGQSWVLIAGSPAQIPMLSMEERDALHSVFKALDSMPSKEVVKESLSQEKPASSGEKPGDDFNAKTSWKEILEPLGWKHLYTANGVAYWRRPGKSTGISATTGRNDGDNLYVFTTSTIFEQERPYSKFAAYAHIHHGGDFSQAARQLRSQGFGSSSQPSLQQSKPTLTLVADLDSDHIEAVEQKTSWWPKPLDLDGAEDEPAPEFLARNDGHKLFYAGKINALLGESESGKTWVALLAVTQALQIQETVMYIDFEDSGRGILNRLRAMGMENRHFATFTYANPDEAFTLEAKIDLVRAIETLNPRLIVVDGVNAAMTLLGLDLTSNRDATFFSQTVLRPLSALGAAVVTIDHVTKSKEGRGNYAIGAQAKRADINGVAIAVEVVMPFGRGMSGELTLKVTKDRPGHVRANSKEAKNAGRVLIQSTLDGKVSMVIESPDNSSFRPTRIMEEISVALEATALSKNKIEKLVGGSTDTIRAALDCLVKEGFVKFSHGARNSLIFESIKEFRQFEAVQQLSTGSETA